MDVISVPRTPKSAFNPKRPVSQLILAQLHHAETAASVPRKKKRAHAIKTEGQAAAYLAELTSALHPRHAPATKPTRRRRPVKRSTKRSSPRKVRKTKARGTRRAKRR